MREGIAGTRSLVTGKAATTKIRGAVRASGALGGLVGIGGFPQASQIINKFIPPTNQKKAGSPIPLKKKMRSFKRTSQTTPENTNLLANLLIPKAEAAEGAPVPKEPSIFEKIKRKIFQTNDITIEMPKQQPPKELGIVAGVDIRPYATDPNHEKTINSIMETYKDSEVRPMVVNLLAKQNKTIAPVTVTIINNASSTYKLSKEETKLMVALMWNDSKLGLQGLGAKTKNPGNVGNDDTGKIVKFKDWQSGANRAAKWIVDNRIQ
jgi:hypothetical protein